MTSLVKKIIDPLLGKSDKPLQPLRQFKPVGIQSGGFNFGVSGNNVTGGATAGRSGLVSQASGLFRQQAGEIRGLRSLVKPGFGQFRTALRGVQEARLARLQDAETRAVGDLRENLARRRVLGSSFGQDALTRARAEFARERDSVISEIGLQEAQTTLQELEATRSLIGDEFNLAQAAVQTFIDNLNVEAQIATQLASSATAALNANAQLQAQILQRQVDNTQSFLTEFLGAGVGAATGGIGGGGLSGSPAGGAVGSRVGAF